MDLRPLLRWKAIGELSSGDYLFAENQRDSKPIDILSHGMILPVALL
jgi:hypothetical protein